MIAKYFDSHSHIASSPKKYSNIDAVIQRAKDAGLVKIVDCAIDLPTSEEVLKLYRKYPEIIIPIVGLHPELLIPGSDIYSKEDINKWVSELEQLVIGNRDNIKAVGECGLDYYWVDNSEQLTTEQKSKIKGLQKKLFVEQIKIAHGEKLPLVVHSRGAEEECLNSLQQIANSEQQRVLFHCYTGDMRTAGSVFKAGFHISFNGILTYKNAEDICEIFKYGWENYKHLLLAETDAPYLKPRVNEVQRKDVEPTMCEPRDVIYVVEK
ncbi:TatD family hydrolase, partial [Patescibacteria group bacterium]